MNDDVVVDVAVFGSGAAGLTAALVAAVHGQRVLLCEKDAVVGGTTATSGGSCWVPCNHHAHARGVDDSIERAAAYLDRVIGVPDMDGRRQAFLDSAPRAFEFLERHSALRFDLPDVYPDYHPDVEGAALRGRTLQPVPFDGRRLGADFALLRFPNRGQMVLGGLMANRPEARHLVRPWSSRKSFAFAVRALVRYAADRARHSRGTRLLLGNALVAPLLLSLRERNVDLWTRAALVALERVDGRVERAIVEREGRRVVVHARRAIVLATGGMSSNARLRGELSPGQPAEWALSTPEATGDGLVAAGRVGAAELASDAVGLFFMPASVMRSDDGSRFAFPHVIADRARPGLIAVDSGGRRFANEAQSYHDFVLAMYANGPPYRAWLVCDSSSLRRYGLGLVRPVWQWRRWYERAGYLVRSDSIEALATRIGVPPATLAQTVRECNDDARAGVDRQFGKGSNALNRFNGDPAMRPNPCLAPIATSPFFAVAVEPAAVAASAGLAVDADARVLDVNGEPIDGLFACGNDQASIMHGAYPGPGITLAPAIAFAFRAIVRALDLENSCSTTSCSESATTPPAKRSS